MSLNGIALVTGARGGIGRTLVARLRARGLRVAAVGRDATAMADVPCDARIAADTTTPDGAVAAFAACREQLGAAPSGLAHAVGSTPIAPLHRTKAAAAREVLRVNLESSLWTLPVWIAALEGAPLTETPMTGGVQTADDVAAVMDWLLSPAAARLTGQVLAVDGGFTTVRPLVK